VELDKSILELEDPALVPRLIQDPNQKATDEGADEQKVIPALLIGQMVPVTQGMDYQTRIGIIMGFLQQSQQMGMQISPQGGQAIVMRLDGLLNGFEEVDTNNARAMRKDVWEYLQAIGLMPSEEQVIEGEAAALETQESMPPGAMAPEELALQEAATAPQ
jgi:hypothetical protein